jgi:polysaccharide pyruvyl transferase WcaK-like protein
MSKTILYGAFGRHNFGDMLFPYILKSLLESNSINTDIEYCDIAEADMTHHGGHDVKSITDFIDYESEINLIQVGGHTANDCNPLQYFPQDIKKKYAPLFHQKDINPSYTLSKKAFNKPNVFVANAVGGFSVSGANKLKEYDYISFRNKNSYDESSKFGLECQFTPDCVVLLKRFYGKTVSRRTSTSENIKSLHNLHGKDYIAVQINEHLLNAHSGKIIQDIKNVIKETKLPIVFFCAGIAPRHDSMKLYKRKFQNILPKNMIYFFERTNVWDICNVISNAKFVIGTSLHVRIVSTVFNVPRITLYSGHADNKAKEFIEQWDTISHYKDNESLTKYIETELKEHNYEADAKQLKFLEQEYLTKSTWVNLLK